MLSSLPEAIRINAPNVVSEVFEQEVVVVNLESGCYFSLMGSAPTIWMVLERGAIRIDQLIETLIQAYDCNNEECRSEIAGFLNQLLEQQLIVPADPEEAGNTTNSPSTAERTLFQPPVLEVFTDLQDILLLDPIHDVDDAGWPVAAPPT